jgi:hypothetical protein
MRIAGGVIVLLVGIWSLVGGGCATTAGCAANKMASVGAEMAKAAQKEGAQVDDKTMDKAMSEVGKAGATVKAMFIPGIVILVAGILCIIAGIMFFVNKAKILGFLAPGVGIIGEILFIVMVGFGIGAIIKIVLYAFGAFAATKIGEQKAA